MAENRVKEYRERAGITQVELSRRARIAAPNLSDIEMGKRVAWAKAKRRLAKALGVTVEVLFPEVNGDGSGK